MRLLPLISLTFWFVMPSAMAATQTMSENNVYVMGDNDTPSLAREHCATLAKAQALEKVGTLVQSEFRTHTTERDGMLHDESDKHISSYIAGIVSAEPVSEQFNIQGGHITLTCTIHVTFDPDRIMSTLQESRPKQQLLTTEESSDKSYSKRSINPADPSKIARSIRDAEVQAMKIDVGMTEQEALAIAGPPRTTIPPSGSDISQWNYGTIWVSINHGLVQCLGYEQNPFCKFSVRLIKK